MLSGGVAVLAEQFDELVEVGRRLHHLTLLEDVALRDLPGCLLMFGFGVRIEGGVGEIGFLANLADVFPIALIPLGPPLLLVLSFGLNVGRRGLLLSH